MVAFLMLLAPAPILAGVISSGDYLQITDLGAGVNPKAINNGGMVVGQNAAGHAFVWTQAGGMVDLGTLGGAQSFANDVNDSGVVVGWSLDAGGVQKAFKWQNGVMTNLDSVSALASVANKINVHGDIVGWKTNGTIFRSSRWLEGNIDQGGQLMFGLGNHKAIGINDQGKIVGVTLDANNDLDEGYYWNGTDSTSSFSGGLGQNYFPLAGVNNHDFTAGMIINSAAVMTIGDSSPINLGKVSPADLFSSALDLNDTGLIVGESDQKGFAFDRSTGNFYNLNDFAISGFEVDGILRLTGINNDGTFVGVATLNGVEHGIRGNFYPIPEPSTFVLVTLGSYAFGARILLRRRCPAAR